MWKGIFFGKKKPVLIIHTYAAITPESIKKECKKQWVSTVKQTYKKKKGIMNKTEGNQFFWVR
jgi:hypothetical protein